jgi:hypothetical protein
VPVVAISLTWPRLSIIPVNMPVKFGFFAFYFGINRIWDLSSPPEKKNLRRYKAC